MPSTIRLGALTIDIVRKPIRNIHLSVHPPTGRVRMAAPPHLSDDALRAFAISRLEWIRSQQRKMRGQERETPREYLNRETHYVWGRRCLLVVREQGAPPSVEWAGSRLKLHIRPGWAAGQRADILEAWYRRQLRVAVEPLMAAWAPRIGVHVDRLFVRRMKTRWGSCNPAARTIRLNTDLAKKPRECLEFILVHELIHLLEPTHNARFVSLMDQHLPGWPQRRDALNRLPVRHEEWRY